MRTGHRRRHWFTTLLLLTFPVGHASAQEILSQYPPSTIVRLAPAPEYAGSKVQWLLFGSFWRETWSAGVDVAETIRPHTGGTLTIVSRSGDSTSFDVELRAGSGERYLFSTLRRQPARVFPQEILDGFSPRSLQDLLSGAYPYAEVITDQFRRAVGLRARNIRVVALSADTGDVQFLPAEKMAIGTLSGPVGRIDDSTLLDTRSVLALAGRSVNERIDAREVLKIRLLEFYIGSWGDRSTAWRWQPVVADSIRVWKPVEFESPLAYCRFNGLARFAAGFVIAAMPTCAGEYPAPRELAWNGRWFDRRVLSSLSVKEYDSLASFIADRITDAVIDSAIVMIPRERSQEDGDPLRAILKERRKGLAEFAREYYAMLAQTVDVATTNSPECMVIRRHGTDGVAVGVYARGSDGRCDSVRRLFLREFRRGETDEVRLLMRGSGDEICGEASANGDPLVRILRDPRDRLPRRPDDVMPTGTIAENDGLEPEDGILIRRPDVAEDRGSSLDLGLMVDYNSEYGPLVGLGPVYYRYGFGYAPYAWTASAIAGVAPLGLTGRLRLSLDSRVMIPGTTFRMNVLVSGYEMSGYFGVGNEVELDESHDASYYHPRLSQYRMTASWSLPIMSALDISVAGSANYVVAQDGKDRLVNIARPYGVDGLAFFGFGGALQYDTRDEPFNPQSGVLLKLAGMRYPKTHGLAGSFSRAGGEVRVFAGGKGTPALTIAMRLAAERTDGDVPYFELANLGGWNGLRGFTTGRYIGDAVALGTVEFRASICPVNFLVPMTFGAGCFVETGRVFVDGETSRRWHPSYGGSLWVAPWSRNNTLSFILGGSQEGMEVYFDVGVGF
jgi:hypothetical protein